MAELVGLLNTAVNSTFDEVQGVYEIAGSARTQECAGFLPRDDPRSLCRQDPTALVVEVKVDESSEIDRRDPMGEPSRALHLRLNRKVDGSDLLLHGASKSCGRRL